MSSVYEHPITVTSGAIDANGHVNNVQFVQWMQDAAVAHSDVVGCTAATFATGAMWVVRSHQIEYKRPAFDGDALVVRTWVADFRRSFSLRKYTFVRQSDQTVLAEGQTDWVYVDAKTGSPRRVPEQIVSMFGVIEPTPRT